MEDGKEVDPLVPPINGKEVDIDHEDERFYGKSNWSSSEELMDTEDLEAGGRSRSLKKLFMADPIRFPTYPRKDIYAFDTKHPYTCQVFNNSSLRQGKSRPLLVQYSDKLYVLSTLMLVLSDGRHFSPPFEMFNSKQGKWATLPTPERFYGRETRLLVRVVVGSYIFLCSSFDRVFRFDMADPSQKWRAHKFTNCIGLPFECITVEFGDEGWVILSCKPELDVVEEYSDPPHSRHFEWKGTFMPAYLMSKDYTLVTPFEPDLKIPHGCLLPGGKPLHVRGIEYKMVQLQGREICLIISVDRGDEPEDGEMERMQTYVMIFEFEIVWGKHTLAFKMLHPLSKIIDDRSSESRTNKVGLEGAFFL
ncbi:hypothetical protein L3X38_030458 [Prunus dulcis]|uniref:Uncharacterized protein n=1 Tax=Prunus dulcis TaxID=3755 RepID=A0AAD4VBU0_PRUDU|nr:hypothetical protein L3X38_030458 [Prunus dulcis]